MRKIIFLLFTILAAWQVKAADKVRFVAEAADVVVSGDQPGEAFHKRYHVLPFVVIPFHVRFRVRSSVMFPLPRHP